MINKFEVGKFYALMDIDEKGFEVPVPYLVTEISEQTLIPNNRLVDMTIIEWWKEDEEIVLKTSKWSLGESDYLSDIPYKTEDVSDSIRKQLKLKMLN